MDCPVCTGVKLLMSDRQGIEIDYCPQCRGVWLDRGELDKIIDRSTSGPGPARPEAAAAYAPPAPPPPQAYGEHHDPRYAGGYYNKKKKREGFLSEIFDFD